MNRIDETFAALRREGRKAFVGYLTAGDPDIEASERNLRTVLAEGVDILELGVPFSDPTADGPAIQHAAHRALEAGATLESVLELVRRLRRHSNAPIVLFGYANPFFRYGYARLAADAAKAGADGFLVVDLPFEEAGEFRQCLAPLGQVLVQLVAPTTTPERMRRLLKDARGFVYYVTVTGVTGQRRGLPEDLGRNLAAIRRLSDLPVVIGFGIGDGAQAAAAARHADGIVVGSALVSAAAQGRLAPLVRDIRFALDARTRTRE